MVPSRRGHLPGPSGPASADDILGIDQYRKAAPTDRRVVHLLQQISALSRRERETLLETISSYVKGARLA